MIGRPLASSALAALVLLAPLSATVDAPGVLPVTASAPAAPAPAAPEPPPVDMSLLPADSPPTPAPGTRWTTRCAEPKHPPATASRAAPLLWGNQLFQLPRLWRDVLGRGRGVTLAVIDTGVARHPLLTARLRPGGDYVGNASGLEDCDGHGTAVAGIAAAEPDPATGFSGVAPGATVLAIRQTSPSFTVRQPDGHQVSAGDTTTLARAVVHAVRLGADVINLSVVNCARPGPAAGPTSLQAAVHFAMEHNVVVVAAAGNAGSGACPERADNATVVLPGWYDADVLTVGATVPSGASANFSYPGPWVDVAAPGYRLLSLAVSGPGLTDRVSDPVDAGGGQLGHLDGTSFAAPSVAGLAVLIRARYPDLTARQVVDRITATARGASSRGWTVGYGVIDPVAALERLPAVLPPPSATPEGTGQLATAPPTQNRGNLLALYGGILALLAMLAATSAAITKSRSH
jgi:membrane-anchored mycosin MYCP